MTCIIAVKDKDGITVGADTQTTRGSSKEYTTEPKIFFKGDVLVGVCGSKRATQLLKYVWELPVSINTDGSTNEVEYDDYNMHNILLSSIKECFLSNNHSSTTNNVEEISENILLCVDGKMYVIESNYCLSEVQHGFVCMGSGEEYAYGAMDALYSLGGSEAFGSELSTENIIRKALTAAGNRNIYCNTEFDFLEMKFGC